MKGRSEEKIWAFGKSDDKNYLLTKATAQSKTSRPEVLKLQEKKSYSNNDSVTQVLKTLNEMRKSINNSLRKSNTIHQNQKLSPPYRQASPKCKETLPVSIPERMYEDMKRNKSCDHVGFIKEKPKCVASSLARRASGALNQVKSPKLNLYHENFKYPPCSKNTETDYPPPCSVRWNIQNTILSSQQIADKSQSFDSLKCQNQGRMPWKCYSVEDGKSRKVQKAVESYTPMTSIPSERFIQITAPNEGNNPEAKTPVHSVESMVPSGRSQFRQWSLENIYTDEQPFETTFSPNKPGEIFRYGDIESILKNFKSLKNPDPAKKYNDLSWQNHPTEGKNICQCPHYHEDLKCSNNQTQEEHEKENNQSTTQGNVALTPRKPKSVSKNLPKTKPQMKESSKQNPAKKLVLWRNENQMPILGEPRQKKSGTKNATVSSSKKQEESETENKQKVLEELQVLEKLFSRLHSVERVLRKRKAVAEQRQNPPETKKCKMSKVAGRKTLEVSQSDTIQECEVRKKKIKSAIILHVQNWLKLDVENN